MPNKDLVHNIDAVTSLSPTARAATANGNAVALTGYDSVAVVFNFGAYTDGAHTPSVQDSPDGATWTDCGTQGLLQYPSSQNGALNAVNSAAGANTLQRVGYIGLQPYVRGVVTVSGATTGAISGATVVRGHPNLRPLA